MSTYGRRELIRTGIALTTLTGAAGVSTAAKATGGQKRSISDSRAVRLQTAAVPEYADWIPDPDEAPVDGHFRGVWHYEMDTVLTLEDQNDGDQPTDPMAANPLSAGAFSVFLWLELEEVGLGDPVIGPAARENDVDPATVPADRGLAIGQMQVYLGSFDEDAIQTAVDDGDFSTTGFDGVYAHQMGEFFVTWNGEAVVVGPTAKRVNRVFETGTGDLSPRHEVDSDFAWLLETTGHGDVTVARLGPGDTVALSEEGDAVDNTMFEGSKGFVQTLTVEDGMPAEATMAVVYADAESVTRDTLESRLGTDASDRSVEQDGRQVTMRASYVGSLDAENDSSEDNSDGDDGPDGDDDNADGGDDGPDGDGGGDSSSDDGDDSSSGESTPGMGAIAALAGLLGGGYAYGRRQIDGDDG